MAKLTGKVALVTGASRGIGKEIALTLAQEGASLAISYQTRSAEANATVDEIKKHCQVDAVAIKADSSVVDQVKDLVDQVAQYYGKLDILVSNAGIEHFAAIDDTRENDFDRVFSVNTRGQYFAVQQAIKYMGRGGRIVCSSSMSATTPFARHAVYAASKAAIEAMVKNLALGLGPRGITINAIAPGPIWTSMAQEHSKEYLGSYPGMTLEQMVKTMVPMGRLGNTDDVARLVSFLVSDDNQWITGQTVHVDGGVH